MKGLKESEIQVFESTLSARLKNFEKANLKERIHTVQTKQITNRGW